MTLSTVKPPVDSRALPPHSQIPLPVTWQPVVEAHLKTEEKVLAWLEIDLNARLRVAKGLVVLTNQRLLARTEDDAEWESHGLCAGLTLTRRDRAGVGSHHHHHGRQAARAGAAAKHQAKGRAQRGTANELHRLGPL